MAKCSIYEVYGVVDEEKETVLLFTDVRGLKRLREGDSFYVWTKTHAKTNDIVVRIYIKDLSQDSDGYAYCVDGLEATVVFKRSYITE